MKQYGNTGNTDDVKTGYPLAAWIWGHRLRVGQHWMEYLLEFLNVLAGFNYQLGQGIDQDVRCKLSNYQRFSRLGLRRFVFYDEHEKTPNIYDTAAMKRLRKELSQVTWLINGDGSGEEPFSLAKKLLRSFSAVEDQRSWYAKSLLPVHHEMLFWEALRKGATKAEKNIDVNAIDEASYDKNITYSDRNFFARGGELYYLILSAGTQSRQPIGQSIEKSINQLLLERNTSLGTLARHIDATWQSVVKLGEIDANTGSLGWLLDPDCALYRQIADDVFQLLQAPLDALEMLDMLAHMIGFHLVLYIYHRAHPNSHALTHADGSCMRTCRPTLMIDLQHGDGQQAIRNVSAATFRDQDTMIRQKASRYVQDQIGSRRKYDSTLIDIHDSISVQFGFSLLRKTTRDLFTAQVEKLADSVAENTISFDVAIQQYTDQLEKLLFNDFDKNFKGVHTKLAKAIGFVAPYKGPNPRFVLSDTLLRAMTFAIIPVNQSFTFHTFLQLLYEHYGLVIGYQEAKLAGLVERHRINSEYYQRNTTAFLEKLQHAGLAVEYSDATALVFGSKV
ncbi:hypothetical protein [Herpetosiphon llansteffanensis]|uniref:hypothetical protein n=1 Tax=Herpetosiphon llansteffanensis TaxID=2094568 RepID=UPI000D7C8B23|nr:hypothetical protein [Herpetosiphon llansteffanensis]